MSHSPHFQERDAEVLSNLIFHLSRSTWCMFSPPSLFLFSMLLVTLESQLPWLLPGTKSMADLVSACVSPLEMEQGCGYRLDQSLSLPSGRAGSFLSLEGLLPLRSYQI